jgi:hypothetical protein
MIEGQRATTRLVQIVAFLPQTLRCHINLLRLGIILALRPTALATLSGLSQPCIHRLRRLLRAASDSELGGHPYRVWLLLDAAAAGGTCHPKLVPGHGRKTREGPWAREDYDAAVAEAVLER